MTPSSERHKPVGRPPLPAGKKKVQIAAKVAPETARYLAAEKERSGKSLGALLDEAAMLHQRSKATTRNGDA